MSEHQPIQLEVERPMQTLGRAIDIILNGEDTAPRERKWGFALLVYPFGENPHRDRMNYIGNGERVDVLLALKALVARWEANSS